MFNTFRMVSNIVCTPITVSPYLPLRENSIDLIATFAFVPLEILKLVTSWKQNIIFYCCISPQYWIFASRVSGLNLFRPPNILQTGSNWFCQPVDLKTRKSAGASCQIEIHFSIQIIKFLMKYNLLLFLNFWQTYLQLLSFNKFHKGKQKI